MKDVEKEARHLTIGVNLRGGKIVLFVQEISDFCRSDLKKGSISMKTNSKKEQVSILEERLRKIPLSKLSRQSGFIKRKPKKIKPKEFILSFIQTVSSSKNTYSKWANQLGILINDTVSKQAISKRIKEPLVILFQLILKRIFEETIESKSKEKVSKELKQFKRILIEDSTNIKLNNKLHQEYPGNRDSLALMKIQSIYEVLQRKFIRFELTSYRKNDQGYSPSILDVAKPGDLIIRDLGYFVLRVFKKLTESGIYYISKLRKEVSIYTKEEEPIDLASMLKKRGSLDLEVFIGEKDKLPARLVAMPVNESVAGERRRKLKAKRDKRLNPSKKHLFLLGWDIFITNIEKEKIESNQISMIYGIRWRIEIIYKSWKSHLRITNLPNDGNKIRLESFIYCMLIFILIFQVDFYQYYLQKINILSTGKLKTEYISEISLLKLTQYLVNNISFIIYLDLFSDHLIMYELLDKQILYYCTYENRKDRINYNQIIKKLG
jgi:hypothetical protein